jgi:hypothetical protein
LQPLFVVVQPVQRVTRQGDAAGPNNVGRDEPRRAPDGDDADMVGDALGGAEGAGGDGTWGTAGPASAAGRKSPRPTRFPWARTPT